MNLIFSSFQLAGYQDMTIPKTDDSTLYKDVGIDAGSKSCRTGTMTNLVGMAKAARSADWLDGQIRKLLLLPSNKIRNILIKSRNGNGNKTLKCIHWNMTNKHWINKIDEIENTIVDFKPDLLLISEANFFYTNPEYKMNIRGYTIVHSPHLCQAQI